MSSEDSFQLARQYKEYCPELPKRNCTNGDFYLKNRVCDGINDCSDWSDESKNACHDHCKGFLKYSKSNTSEKLKFKGLMTFYSENKLVSKNQNQVYQKNYLYTGQQGPVGNLRGNGKESI